jgi:hypothetical protein
VNRLIGCQVRIWVQKSCSTCTEMEDFSLNLFPVDVGEPRHSAPITVKDPPFNMSNQSRPKYLGLRMDDALSSFNGFLTAAGTPKGMYGAALPFLLTRKFSLKQV